MSSSAIMNPAYFLSSSTPRQHKLVSQAQSTRDSFDSEYSLVKPTENISSKNKPFLSIFEKNKKPKQTSKPSMKKVRETNIHDIAYGTSAWK